MGGKRPNPDETGQFVEPPPQLIYDEFHQRYEDLGALPEQVIENEHWQSFVVHETFHVMQPVMDCQCGPRPSTKDCVAASAIQGTV